MTVPFLIFVAVDFVIYGCIMFVAGYLVGNAKGHAVGYRTGLTGRAAAYREAEVTTVVRR